MWRVYSMKNYGLHTHQQNNNTHVITSPFPLLNLTGLYDTPLLILSRLLSSKREMAAKHHRHEKCTRNTTEHRAFCFNYTSIHYARYARICVPNVAPHFATARGARATIHILLFVHMCIANIHSLIKAYIHLNYRYRNNPHNVHACLCGRITRAAKVLQTQYAATATR